VKTITRNAKPRVQLRPDVVADLVACGVPDAQPDIARAVNEITKMAVARGNACLTDLGDIAVLEAALVERLDVLACLHSQILEELSELMAIEEEAAHGRAIQLLIRGLPE
jgi:hypothetical protein